MSEEQVAEAIRTHDEGGKIWAVIGRLPAEPRGASEAVQRKAAGHLAMRRPAAAGVLGVPAVKSNSRGVPG